MAPIWKCADKKETPWDKKEAAILDREIKRVPPAWTQPGPEGRAPAGRWQAPAITLGDRGWRLVSFHCLTDPVVVLSLVWTTKYLLVKKGSFVNWRALSLIAPPSLTACLHLLPQLHPFTSLQVHTDHVWTCFLSWQQAWNAFSRLLF